MPHVTPQLDAVQIIAARVRASSVAAVARDLRMPREQIARLAGGLPVRPGTLALARERLIALGEERRTSP
jgi:hypothetical protein